MPTYVIVWSGSVWDGWVRRGQKELEDEREGHVEVGEEEGERGRERHAEVGRGRRGKRYSELMAATLH